MKLTLKSRVAIWSHNIQNKPGILADTIGWYAPYYFYGCLGVCWYMLWLWLAFEKPAKHPSISPR